MTQSETMGHTESSILKGKVASSQTLFERYTEATRRALEHARNEARRRGDSVVTVADLLAGLMYEEGTRAERVGSLKANALYLRWLSGLPQLPALVHRDEDANAPRPEFDFESKRAIAFAVMEADRDREYWIDSDHLLRGLLRFPNKAQFAILKTEVNLERARVGSRRDREEHLPGEASNLKVFKYLARKHFALWVPPIVSLACYLYILMQGFGMELAPLAR